MLILTRDSGYADRLRKYKVLVDGAVIGEIGNGETKSFDVAPGNHTLQLKIDWAGSNIAYFAQDASKDSQFRVASALRGANIFLAIFYAIFYTDKYLVLEQVA